jgi:membrane protease YdiL (CAAX protease family)
VIARLAAILLLAAAFSSTRAFDLPVELATVPEPSAKVREIDASIRAQFDATVHDYDMRIAAHPEDVAGAVQRCKFMDEFAGTYEYASFVDSVYEDSEDCYAQLLAHHAEHPEIVLAGLERIYGKELLDRGVEVLAETARQSWTAGQLSRLHTMLASAAQTLEDKRALEFARSALSFDEAADVRLIVAEHLAQLGDKRELIAVLTSPADRHDANDTWYAVRKMQLLADAGARDGVVQIYNAIKEHESLDAVSAASALRKAGAIDAARDAFARIGAEALTGQRVAAERFRFELEYGTAEHALAAYDAWRDGGWSQDPLGINRVALMLQAPLLPLRARDLLGILGFLGALLVIAIASIVPVALVHYRGLARRARHAETYPAGGWQLKHAWLALFGFFAASLLAIYCAGPLTVMTDAGAWWAMDATPQQLARIALSEQLLAFALLLPLGVSAMRAQPRWWGAHWHVLKSIWVGTVIAVVLRTPLLLGVLATSGELHTGGVQQELWQLLGYVREGYGTTTALWLVVLSAPVIEELIFRGALLRAFAAHVRFGWANVIQALLFAAIHFDLRAMPVLFVVGLTAGFLAYRSGGLLAPMVMHLVFNLIAALIFIL